MLRFGALLERKIPLPRQQKHFEMTSSFWTLLLGLLLGTLACSDPAPTRALPQRIDLNGTWELIDPETQASYAATVPGTAHTDLLANGAISDPYYRNNELALQYLENKNWHYRRRFSLRESDLGAQRIELICEGLDTYARVVLNGVELGRTQNMFREWTFAVGPQLQVGDNQLDIYFTSPFAHQAERVQSLGYVLPADNEAGEQKYGPFCRKAPYHFGWDWGPRLVSSGIWRDIYLLASDGLRLVDHSVQTLTCHPTEARLVLRTIVDSDSEGTVAVQLDDWLRSTHRVRAGRQVLLDTFRVAQPRLWWPNGRGPAELYDGRLRLERAGQLLADEPVRFGIRTVELVHEADSIGTSFYLVVNGEPLFAKGANYIPQDVFVPRVSAAQYRRLLGAAQAANMNMLRVWGGGIYENDIFYELCDSLGLLVWQDFMFAGTMYPIDEAFTAEVEREVRYQVERLSKHPSVALWCGNNEIEVAWHNWGWQEKYAYSDSVQAQLWRGYEALFKRQIPRWLGEAGAQQPYTRTSPLSNWGTAENFNHASMHYWGVWHGRDSIEAFADNVGRFMVEYGMQSYPDTSTIARFALAEDRALDSEVMRNRQKSYIGNGEILRQIQQRYSDPVDFVDFVDKSQRVQAEAMRMAIEAHRGSGGHCMGSLLWQLNDCWPGPSWSIIDYYGRPKRAYGAVRAAFGD